MKKTPFEYVDNFWGNGGTDNPPSVGMAKAWNWHKAQTGNTNPAAQMPFGWVSALPYSGGYASGYGNVGCSSDGPPPQISDRKSAWGVSHFHASGTGFLVFFYNYMLITPSIPGVDTREQSILTNEIAYPGYYAASLPDYGADLELTCGKFAALHRWKFHADRGRLIVDATNIGLKCPVPKRYLERIEFMDFRMVTPELWHGFVEANGVKLYFSLKIHGNIQNYRMINGKLTLDIAGSAAETVLAFSLVSTADADVRAADAEKCGFEKTVNNAKTAWEKLLNAVKAEFNTDAEYEIFYSALYHSLVKPADAGSEYIDFHTMWDIYRTQLPLMLSIAPADARNMLLSMLNTIHRFGFFPNGYQMSSDYHRHDMQASGLVLYTLCDGFFRNLLTADDYPKFKSAVLLELKHADINGKSPTHRLDLAGALHAAALVAEMNGDDSFASEMTIKSHIWQKAYDPHTGLMTADGIYYEGTHWNYSFRPHTGMKKRIEIAGGTEKFNALLDEFFCVNCSKKFASDRPMHDDHFEGMNNESDMETPYCYLWAGRSDRLAEVCDLIRRCRFTTGSGGCPGNNDSGGLSSWYVWCCLGIYPLTGTPYYLLGSPSVANAEINFANASLKIEVAKDTPDAIYPAGYEFNGRKFAEPWLPAAELEKGGTLKFYLSGQPVSASPIPDWL
ncbi:MAG: glycoside hydrolase family 92 protein [Lentisphaeria bacterium]|nr:glycoside hydrolase family 92 protein [Lentisphaeria bacterium]